MLRDKKHKSWVADVTGVAKVLDYTEEGELLLEDYGIDHKQREVIVDRDRIQNIMINKGQEGGEVNTADFNDEVRSK